MYQIEEFVDERHKSWCVHCGGSIATLVSNSDHVPTKSLLQKPYPDNLPVVKICKDCNSKYALDEEYFYLFLQCVMAGSTDPDRQIDSKAGRALRRNPKLRSRIESSKREYETIGGEIKQAWKPEITRIKRVILKNARGHAFYEYGEPIIEEPNYVWFAPLESLSSTERLEFENSQTGGAFPEVGSRMLTRVLCTESGLFRDLFNGWVQVQDGVYRYCVMQEGQMLVRSVLFEYLASEVYWDY